MADRSSVLTNARARVAKVREDLGFPKQDIWESLTAIQRDEWTGLLRIKDNMVAASPGSELIYQQGRFVFELLQNAEDNHYEKARGRGEVPRVSFHVYPHKIVQECNEDGFTEINLKAICAVGQSSKHGDQGYVGEKGIGFKSVFMAAYRVHIQSRGLSFSFEHRPSDTGLGMVTPEWQDPQDDLEEYLSRITLLLHDEGDAEELTRQRARIRAQFAEIHDTLLLFLKKLDQIVVAFHDDDADEAKVTKRITFTINRNEAGRRVLTKRTSEGDMITEDTKYYHITQQLVNGLAGNENRIYTEREHETRGYATSEITLAFPLTRENVPVVHDQWFLIQADFVTQANRQGIVVDSPRNEGLRRGIINAFVTAIKQMCKHPTLAFQWMRYLPKPDDTVEDYWSYLIEQITKRIQETRVMVPRFSQPSMDTFRLIQESATLRPRVLDSSGEPLLRDIYPEVYLSPAYQKADLLLLSSFGLKHVSIQAIIARVKWDLEQTDSRIKSIEDQDWQSRMAKLLRLPFSSDKHDLRTFRDQIRALDLLPLRSGQWRSNTDNQKAVYYSKVAGTDLDIPEELDLDVVCPSSTTNEARKELFDSMGVTHASVTTVRNVLIKFHQGSLRMGLYQSAYHLRFLYLTHHLAITTPTYTSIWIMTDKCKFFLPRHRDNIYLRDESPHGAGQLLEPTPAGDMFGDGSPGFEVTYVHGYYLKDAPSPLKDDKESFNDWLHRYFNVRQHIPIADAEGKNLSDACRYIAAHRPERFLGFLFDSNGNILQELRKIPVLCERGDETGLVTLKNTYLPLDTLRGLCDRFLLDDEMFPFLRLAAPLSDETLPLEWKELDKTFHLGMKELDLVDLSLDILKTIKSCNEVPDELDTPRRVLDLYIFLQGKVLESNNQKQTRDRIRHVLHCPPFTWSFFDNGTSYIYIPQSESMYAMWTEPDKCVWQAPTGIGTTVLNSLFHLYSPHFQSQVGQLGDSFLDTLGIQRKCTWENIVEELQIIKLSGDSDLDTVHKLYKFLHSLDLGPVSRGQLRAAFTEKKLVYGGEEGEWYATTKCLWSSPTRIRTMLVVQPLYEDLEDFFVNLLGVETQTAKMVYEKLTAEETTRLPIEEIKDTILAFSSLLASEGSVYDPGPVLQNKVFPVRLPGSGVRLLQNGNEGFAIWDRKPLGDAFLDEAKFLDFSMDLVRGLGSFIEWAGLGNRYLSKAVKDFSAVDSSLTRVVTSPRLLVQTKAHALVRIAVTYNSPRAGNVHDREALYRYLSESQTLETSKITSELHLHQDGRVLKVEKETALLHIREDDSGLKIYVPEDEIDQEICFRSKLPQRLCEWLMTNPSTQIPDLVPTQAQGIPEIPLADKEDDEGGGIPDETASRTSRGWTHDAQDVELSPYRTLASGNDATGAATPSSSNPSRSRSSSRDGRNTEAHSTSHGRASGSRVSVSPASIAILVQPSLAEYTRLLTLTVAQAREAVFPSPRGSLNIPSRLQRDVTAGGPYSLHAYGKLERDRMIGAAGELFVFELLSKLRAPTLPGFNIDNWKSTIRHYAVNHPEYGDIRRFTGPETSDITYDDTDGALTNLLVAKDYIPVQVNSGERIGYSIEVKTTTDACETPFYMSNSQYLMMQRQSIQNASQQSPDKIYLIFRVYHIGRSSIGLRILVDPERLKQTGTLAFTANTWSVAIRD
ncbi:uncharacterized protein PG986_011358 [Apiospora aurea]|uniref:Protein NO VEIN C-terminal domain-containing protein n=1 Tax=Apiospora aurea TaxID=335848 RepID=A0ABR1Q4W6_9PEZI